MIDMSNSRAAAAEISRALLGGVAGSHRAVVEAAQPGIVAGFAFVDREAVPVAAGAWRILAADGQHVETGEVLVEVSGSAAQIAVAEDYVLGPLGFASGVATRAAAFRAACPPGMSIACGGWKKLPAALKPLLRAGLHAAGVLPRLVPGEFVYVSKNAVALLGDVDAAIRAAIAVDHGPVAVQVKDVEEALYAARAGAGVIMVDTGVLGDLGAVHDALRACGLRDRLTLAFGGGVRLEDLERAWQLGAQAVDVGRAILDAPLLDLRMRVVPGAR